MKRVLITIAALLLAACSSMPSWMPGGGWTTLIDGEKGLENFNRVGDANWRPEGGAIVADKTTVNSYLVTKESYKDFEIRAEFWADKLTNSGVFLRLQDRRKVGADNAYEVNIYDARPGPEYATAAIVGFAKTPVPSPHKAAGQWNTFEITAKGPVITVVFNGQKTVELRDAKMLEGPFALQFGLHGKVAGDAIKWRKVQVKPL
jgi:Domain of Unknown Function (DUF1080)